MGWGGGGGGGGGGGARGGGGLGFSGLRFRFLSLQGSGLRCNVALIIRIGFWEFLIMIIVQYTPKPYSTY